MPLLFVRGFSRAAMLASVAALAFAAPATASVTATLVGNNLTAASNGDIYALPGGAAVDFNGGNGYLRGVSVNALSNLSSTEISFKNGIAATGNTSRVSATTGVAITFTNDEAFAVKPVLNSTLLAAGIGVYATSNLMTATYTSGTLVNTPGICSSGGLTNCGTPTGNAASYLNAFGKPSLASFGESTAGFSFDVSVDGASIYALNGSMGVTSDNQYYQNFNGADRILSGFASTSDPNDPYARTFSWGDTAVDIALPDWLAPGASVTAIYTITTYASMGPNAGGLYANFNGSDITIAGAIAYASFGDPVGRGGTSGNIMAGRGIADALTDASSITGLNTNAVGHFALPTGHVDPITHEYVVDLRGVTVPGRATPEEGAVPEPASWALMLGGFGLVGSALRRRRMALA